MKDKENEIVKQQNPRLEIENWDYTKAVEEAKPLAKAWKENTLELARVLYKAKIALSQSGFRRDLYNSRITSGKLAGGSTSGDIAASSQSKILTYQDFLEDIGLSPRTARYRLEYYDPSSDTILTSEEVKARKESEWDSLCRDIHHHRTHGEPLWKPEKWNDTLEFRYEEWLEAHGYKKRMAVDPSILNSIGNPAALDYPVAGPFTFDFIDSIGHYCVEETTRGEGAVSYFNMCERWKSRVPKGIEPNRVLRIPVLVKGAIAQLPKEARKEATILVANILRDYVEGEV